MKRLWIGWGFASVAGILLAIGFLQVRSMHECGFFKIQPPLWSKSQRRATPIFGKIDH
jgi:hypothetical protein